MCQALFRLNANDSSKINFVKFHAYLARDYTGLGMQDVMHFWSCELTQQKGKRAL